MSDKYTQSIELSDTDLDNVAGGTGYDPHKHMGGFAAAFSDSTAAAVGGKVAFTTTKNDTVAISQPGIQVAASSGHSSAFAAS